MHPAIKTLLQGFADKHQPEYLRHVTRPCAELAHAMAARLQSPGLTTRQLRALISGLRLLAAAMAAFELAAAEQHGSGSSTPTGAPSDGGPAAPPRAQAQRELRERHAVLARELPPTREGKLQVLAGSCRGEMRFHGAAR